MTEIDMTTPNETTEKVQLKRLVGVQFSLAGKVHSFSAEGHDLTLHDLVVVEGDKGPIIGKVIIPPYDRAVKEVATNIRAVLRKAGPEDIERHENNREEAMRAFHTCQKKVVDHDLSMKLVDVDILKGDGKAIFYFTAEERVDFRGLVKDLATALHMRIEMRQIGARDAAKSIGAIGGCGLTCCCETHLREFKSIAIQMAKNQGLSPNPAKLTGMCGKLKCCMNYENEMYTQLKKKLPSPGERIKTTKGAGIVTGLDIPRQIVYTRMDGEDKDVKLSLGDIMDIEKRSKNRPRKNGLDPGQKEVPEQKNETRPVEQHVRSDERRDGRRSEKRRAGETRRPEQSNDRNKKIGNNPKQRDR